MQFIYRGLKPKCTSVHECPVQLVTYFAFHSGKYQLYTVYKSLIVQPYWTTAQLN